MINLLFGGQPALFFLILIALVISLSFHEFGHAATAKLFGDDTAQRMGRLTLNPLAHIDAMGLLMLVFVGFGWAKPVPTDPRNFRSRWADLWVSAAGPGMNLLLAFVAVNFYSVGVQAGWGFLQGSGAGIFFFYLATINLILMLFNLIPLGALDGHYILPYFLDSRSAAAYRDFNARYGNMALMGLVLLSMVGVPVFHFIFGVGRALLPYLIVL
jgi:Zn-dependent protease